MGYDGEKLEDISAKINIPIEDLRYLNDIPEHDCFQEALKVNALIIRNW